MDILVCPSGFKGSLDPQEAADCIARGIQKAAPNARIRKAPMFDGGEGTARGLVAATEGQLRTVRVCGPVHQPIESHYGILGGDGPKTVVVEMAAAAGLSLVPEEWRDPTTTTSYGVGELMRAALDEGAERILIGCGDSGTSDAGMGACQALGIRFLDVNGHELSRATENLRKIATIDMSGVHPRIYDVRIEVACNWTNVLCGPNGVARVYGPQKGATPEQVDSLAQGLDTFAAVAGQTLNQASIGTLPGSGASGGLGAGLLLMGAILRPRYEVISEYLGVDGLFQNCQLVITAEGAIDFQTPRGKIPTEISRRAKEYGLPVICLAGTVGDGAEVSYQCGIDAFTSILQRPGTLGDATRHAEKLLQESAESTIRTVLIGSSINAAWEARRKSIRKASIGHGRIRSMSLKTQGRTGSISACDRVAGLESVLVQAV